MSVIPYVLCSGVVLEFVECYEKKKSLWVFPRLPYIDQEAWGYKEDMLALFYKEGGRLRSLDIRASSWSLSS